MSELNRRRETVDAEFEVVEIDTIADAPVNGLFQQLKQNLAKFFIISLIIVIALVLLFFAFYLFLAFVLIGLVLRLFGGERARSVTLNTMRFRR